MAAAGPAAISPDATLLATVSYDFSMVTPDAAPPTIQLLELPTGDMVADTPPPPADQLVTVPTSDDASIDTAATPTPTIGATYAVTFVDGGRAIDVVGYDGAVMRTAVDVSIADGSPELGPAAVPVGRVEWWSSEVMHGTGAFAESPDGRLVALPGTELSVRSLDGTRRPGLAVTLAPPDNLASDLQGELSPDGTRLAVGSPSSGVMQVFDQAGAAVGPLIRGFGGFFGPDSNGLIAGHLTDDGSGRVDLWFADATMENVRMASPHPRCQSRSPRTSVATPSR